MKIQGLIVALATPFSQDEELNLSVLPDLIDRLIENGANGIFAAGSMGEGVNLCAQEKVTLCKACVRAINGRVPFLMGTGSPTTREVISLNQQLEDEGVDAFSVLTPMYWETTQEEIYRYFSDIIDQTKKPVLAYNIPRNTGRNLEPATVKRLYQNAGLAGAKDSSGNIETIRGYIENTGEDFCMLVGTDALIYDGLCLGAKGAISAPSNALTRVSSAICKRFAAGDREGARQAQEDWREVLSLLNTTGGTFPGRFKRAASYLTAPVGNARRPVLPPDEEKFLACVPRLEQILAKYA